MANAVAYCQTNDKETIINKIKATEEYKAEVKRAPALSKANGRYVEIIVEIDNKSYNNTKAPSRDTITAFIKEDMGKLSVVSYRVLIDRKTMNILKVIDELDGMDVSVQ
jgi:hypothetical protein